MAGLKKLSPNGSDTLLGRASKQKDIEFEQEQAALVRDAQRRRDDLEKARFLIFEHTEWALHSKSVNQEEKATLQKHLDGLDDVLRILDKVLSNSAPGRKVDILYIADELLWRGMALGHFFPPSKPVIRHHKEQAHTASMRDARANKPEEDALGQSLTR